MSIKPTQAAEVVRSLLEAGGGFNVRASIGRIFDLRAASQNFKTAIEDDLYEWGWGSLTMYPSSYASEFWAVRGSFFDKEHREYWFAAGARVIDAPRFTPVKKAQIVSFAKRTFMKAAKAAGYVIGDVRAAEFDKVYSILDLESAEASLGDWYLTLEFKIDLPVAKMHT